MSGKNKAPKYTGASKKNYLANYHAWRGARNAANRKKRHDRRVLKQLKSVLSCRVRRGTGRSLRRKNIVLFHQLQRERAQAFTGTVKVNAPSLSMENRFIGVIPEGFSGLKVLKVSK